MDDFDDIFGMLEDVVAAPVKQQSEEEWTAKYLLDQPHKLANMTSWIGMNVSVYLFMVEDENLRFVKDVVKDNGMSTRNLTRTELGRHFIKYFMYMYHLPHFKEIRGVAYMQQLDIEKVIDLLAKDPRVHRVIHKDY